MTRLLLSVSLGLTLLAQSRGEDTTANLSGNKSPTTILPLGDSITAGGGGGGGFYRHYLNDRLKTSGMEFTFIGPHKDKKGLCHAGYAGWSSTKLRSIIGKVYKKYPADIVLIHMGHNHFSKNKPVPTILKNTRFVLDTIYEINPSAKVYLAQVVTVGKLPKYSYIPALNVELAKLAGEYEKRKRAVVLVNHAKSFDWRKHAVKDKVHPNEEGARLMAETWAAYLCRKSSPKIAQPQD